MTYTQRRLNEYCKKFGLCKTGETCQCKKELKFIAETIHQALAEDRERVRGEIEERKIPEIIDPEYFEKDGIGKTLLLKMTHNTAYNYGLKHGYNQALCDLR